MSHQGGTGDASPPARPLLPAGPGAIWLVLFFVVPMYFMGELALRSGSIATGGFTFTWEWSNFPDALSGNDGADRALVLLRGASRRSSRC